MEDLKVCEEKAVTPLDGEIYGRYENYDHMIDCGSVVIYPRGDGSIIIDRIGPMLGRDRCNVIKMDVGENYVTREYDKSYKSIIARVPHKYTKDEGCPECPEGSLDGNYEYLASNTCFELFNDAYSSALNSMSNICRELYKEYMNELSPKQTDKGRMVIRVIEKGEHMHIGQCIMCVINDRIMLFRINNKNNICYTEETDDWNATSFSVSYDKIDYNPNDTFAECLIFADISNPTPFGAKRFVFCEITQEAFNSFEKDYCDGTKLIQELREVAVEKITEMEYYYNIQENQKAVE